MDKNKSPKGRKRPAKEAEQDFFWDCSVCTYKNNPEAFKCVMCDVGKGTSTRKSRINQDLVAVQVQHALLPPPPPLKYPRDDSNRAPSTVTTDGGPSTSHEVEGAPEEGEQPGRSSEGHHKVSAPPRGGGVKSSIPRGGGSKIGGGRGAHKSKLRNVDRKNATTMSVTVDNVTVVITEYKLKTRKDKTSDTSRDNSIVEASGVGGGPGSSKAGSGADSDGEHGGAGGSRDGPVQSRGPSEELV